MGEGVFCGVEDNEGGGGGGGLFVLVLTKVELGRGDAGGSGVLCNEIAQGKMKGSMARNPQTRFICVLLSCHLFDLRYFA